MGDSAIERVPDVETEAEVAVVGVTLTDANAAAVACTRLRPEQFHDPALATIFTAALEIFNSGARPDLAAVVGRLEVWKELDHVGGAAAVAELAEHGLRANIDFYITRVVEGCRRREARRSHEEALRDLDEGVDLDEVEDRHRRSIPAAPKETADRAAVLRYKPFPVEVLPAPLDAFVARGAESIGCDTAYVGLPVLSSVAGVVGVTRLIQLKATYREPLIVWAVVCAPSGTHKSPSLDLAAEPIRQIQEEAFAEYADCLERYNLEFVAHQGSLAKWKRRPKGLPPPEPVRPVAERFIVSDVTVEALAPILQANRWGVLLVRDELSGWIGGFNQYRRGRGGDAALWCEAHRAGPWSIDRKTADLVHVPRAALSITGTIQPGVMARVLGGEHLESGLAARILFSMPPTKPPRWTEAIVEPGVTDPVRDLFRGLVQLRRRLDAQGITEPAVMVLDEGAQRRWVTFYNEEADTIEGAGDEALRAALSKLRGYAGRFAGLVHVVREATGEVRPGAPVDAASVDAGARLARWFAHEARRVYALLTGGGAERKQQELIDLIVNRGGRVRARDLQRGPRRFREPGAAEGALNNLVAAGFGQWTYPPPGPDGGAPGKVFVLRGDDGDGDRTPAGSRKNSDYVAVAGVASNDDHAERCFRERSDRIAREAGFIGQDEADRLALLEEACCE